jgi:drug/metabolite transporter (DMT)-like permease
MITVSPGQRRQALLLLVSANVFWGLSFPLIKSLALVHQRLLPDSSTLFVTAWGVGPRFILAFLLLFAWQGRRLFSATPAEWKQGLGLGFFAAAGMLFQTDGLQFTEASTSAFLTQFYAILIPVFLAVKGRRLPPWTVWLSSGLVLVGVAILGRFDLRRMHLGRGEWETLIGSVFFMGQILWLERRIYAGNRVLPVTLVMFGVEAVTFLLLALVTSTRPHDLIATWSSSQWVLLTVAMALACTLVPLLVMNTFQPRITATEAGLIYCAEPVFGSIFALFLPALLSAWAQIEYGNESATVSLLVGGGLITIANVVIQLKPLPEEPV